MPAIDFPAAPAVNDEYSFEGRTWRWNATGWEVKEYPAALLAGTAANPSLYFSGDPNTGIYSPSADTLAASTAGSERLRIDSSGRLLVGTSTARSNFANSTTPGVQLPQTISITRPFDDQFSCNLILGKSRGSGNVVVQVNDNIGNINFEGNDGTNFVQAATIRADVDGTPGTNDMPGRLVFSTTADGASSPTERLRITSAGVLQIADAGNITVGTTTGTKIGTATTQKLGFYNATPVVQPAAVANATDAASVIARLNDLLARLRTLGIIAT